MMLALILANLTLPICMLLGLAALLRDRGMSPVDALACAFVPTLACLSFCYQGAFLLGAPRLAFLLEAAVFVIAVAGVRRHRAALRDLLFAHWRTLRAHPALSILVLAVAQIALVVTVLPIVNSDALSYNVARVVLMERSASLWPSDFSFLAQVVFPASSDVLAYLPLKWGTDHGAAWYAAFAYAGVLAIGAASARRLAGGAVVATTLLVTASQTALLLMAAHPKNDLAAAVAACAAVLHLQRMREKPNFVDGALLAVAIAFGVGAKSYFLAAGGVLSLLALSEFRALLRLDRSAGKMRAMAVALPFAAALVVVSNMPTFVRNALVYGAWSGPKSWTSQYGNHDGVVGAAANLIRYGMQVLDGSGLLNGISLWLTGSRLSLRWVRFHHEVVQPTFGDAGMGYAPFHVVWSPSADLVWFGPLAATLGCFAVLRALSPRGNRLARHVAWIQITHLVAICVAIPWYPWNGRFMALPFALMPVVVAQVLASWSPRRQRPVRIVAIGLLIYGLMFNDDHPVLPRHLDGASMRDAIETQNIWIRSDWGQRRAYRLEKRFGEGIVERELSTIPKNERIILVSEGRTHLLHMLLARPDIDIEFRSPESLRVGIGPEVGAVLCFGLRCPSGLVTRGWKRVWMTGLEEPRESEVWRRRE